MTGALDDGLLGALLPPLAASYELPIDATPDALLPGEEDAVRHAVDRRRHEFAVGRTCARRALARLGVAPAPIPMAPDRTPTWPAGIVGSISHSTSMVVAVVAPRSAYLGVGVDAEPNAALPSEVIDTVVRPDEQRWLAAGPPAVASDRLLFSIKESVYKAWYPLTRRWLDFSDVRLDLDLAGRSFVAELLVDDVAVEDRSLRRIEGRFVSSPADLIAVVLVAR